MKSFAISSLLLQTERIWRATLHPNKIAFLSTQHFPCKWLRRQYQAALDSIVCGPCKGSTLRVKLDLYYKAPSLAESVRRFHAEVICAAQVYLRLVLDFTPRLESETRPHTEVAPSLNDGEDAFLKKK